MISMSLFAAAMAGLCCYLSSRHQTLWRGAARRARSLLCAAALAVTLAVLLASPGHGVWGGLFIALSGVMLALVVLPFVDAWRRSRHAG